MTGFPQPGHRRQPERATLALVAAILALLLAAPPGFAQFSISSQKKEDKNAPIVFQADEVEYDDQLALTVAKGHVEISQGGEVLLADTVSYNQRTDTITASGHVSLLEPTGEVTFADFMELRDSMNDVFAQNVRRLLADRSRLVANAARRINGNHFELRRAVYSPCDLCKKDPSAPPAWQLKAREITDDKELKLIEFRDAVIEVDGWPVLYTPYLSEPDPSVKRASGFLTPTFGNSNTVGFHMAIPYYFVLGPDNDLTVAPRFTSRAGELLAGEYRQRFSDATLDAIGSINYSNVGLRQRYEHRKPMARPRQRHRGLGHRRHLPGRVRAAAGVRSDLPVALRLRHPAAERDDQPRLSRRLRAERDDRRQCLHVPTHAARAWRLDAADRAPGHQSHLAEPTRRARRRVESQRQSARHRPRSRDANPPDLARHRMGQDLPRRHRRGIQTHRERARGRLFGQQFEQHIEPRSAQRVLLGERRAAGATHPVQLSWRAALFRSSG